MASKKIQGITIEIDGNTTNLGKALKDVDKIVYNTNAELKDLNKALKLDPSNTTLLSQKYEVLKTNIEASEKRLDKLKTAQKQMGDYNKLTDEQKENYRALSVEITKSEEAIKKLTKEYKEFGSVAAQKIAAAGENVKEFGGKVENAGKKILPVSAGVTALGVAAISTGVKFDSAMKQVAATMGITIDEINNGSESYKTLEEAAEECGKTTKFSASEAAEALNYLALAGYSAEKSAATLPKVLNLAAAGNMNLATASDMVTDAMSALGLETQDLDRYIDEMAKTSQKSNTSVSQLGEATLTVAGTAKLANMSLETMNAELGILANNGLKGSEGGTHLRNIILSLTSPTDVAATALSNLGISAVDTEGNIRDLNDIMTDFNTKLDGLSDGEKTEIISTIFNKTDISAVNALIKGSGEEFANLKKEIEDSNGAAQDMADVLNGSVEGQLTLLKSQLEGISNQFAEILLPVLLKVISKVSSFLEKISNLSPTMQKVIVIIGGIVAAAGPLLIFVAKMIDSVGTIMKVIPKLTGVIKGLIAFITGANPVTWIVVAIAAVIGVLVLLYNKCEWFRDGVNAILTAIKDFFVNIWEAISTFFTETIPNAFNNLLTTIGNWWNSVVDFFKSIPERIHNFITNVVTFFEELPYNLGLAIGKMIGHIAQFFIDVYEFVTTEIPNIIANCIEFLKELPGKVWEWLVETFNKVHEWGVNTKEKAKEIGKNFVDSIIGFFRELPGKIWNFFTETITKVINWRNDLVKKGKEAASDFFNTIVDKLKELPGQMLEIGKNIVNGVWDGIKKKKDEFKEKINSFFSGIVDGVKSVLGIHSPSKIMKEQVGENIGLGVVEGIEDTVSDIENAMKGLNYKVQTSINPIINPNAINKQLTDSNSFINNTLSIDYNKLAIALAEQLSNVKVVMNEEEMGKFVVDTVTDEVYT